MIATLRPTIIDNISFLLSQQHICICINITYIHIYIHIYTYTGTLLEFGRGKEKEWTLWFVNQMHPTYYVYLSLSEIPIKELTGICKFPLLDAWMTAFEMEKNKKGSSEKRMNTVLHVWRLFCPTQIIYTQSEFNLNLMIYFRSRI